MCPVWRQVLGDEYPDVSMSPEVATDAYEIMDADDHEHASDDCSLVSWTCLPLLLCSDSWTSMACQLNRVGPTSCDYLYLAWGYNLVWGMPSCVGVVDHRGFLR